MARRTPLSWGILTAAMVSGAYVLVTGFEGYDATSPVCTTSAVITGRQDMPTTCRFPLLQVFLGAGLIGGGMALANKLNRPR